MEMTRLQSLKSDSVPGHLSRQQGGRVQIQIKSGFTTCTISRVALKVDPFYFTVT